jgi:L-lactate dehydrogenase
VSARIAEMVLRDERTVIPIGSFQPVFGVTLSLPSVVGRVGVISVLQPDLSPRNALGWKKVRKVCERHWRGSENSRRELERMSRK